MDKNLWLIPGMKKTGYKRIVFFFASCPETPRSCEEHASHPLNCQWRRLHGSLHIEVIIMNFLEFT